MPRFSQNPGGPAACAPDSHIAVRLQTEPNPCVEQRAAFQLASLFGDFDSLSLRCNVLAIARAFFLDVCLGYNVGDCTCVGASAAHRSTSNFR
jgi:hypothetical protein